MRSSSAMMALNSKGKKINPMPNQVPLPKDQASLMDMIMRNTILARGTKRNRDHQPLPNEISYQTKSS